MMKGGENVKTNKTREKVQKPQHVYTQCPNCGTGLVPEFEFCPQCGQANHDLNMPLSHLVAEAVESIVGFDSRSVRTIKALSMRPGLLTSEFIKGRHARYISPVRLYLLISFLFFLLMAISAEPSRLRPVSSDEGSTLAGRKGGDGGFAVSFYGINSKEIRGMGDGQIDSLMRARSIESTAINRYVVRQMSRMESGERGEFIRLLVQAASYSMFLLMPLFAFLVLIFHKRKAPQYIGTLVFSIHYHSFVFLFLILMSLVNRALHAPVAMAVPFIVCPLYLFFSLMHVFGDVWWRALIKAAFLGFLQGASIIILFVGTVFTSLLLF